MLTVPSLFAPNGRTGPRLCFYCGASCDESNPAETHVKPSFTGRSTVRAPGSSWVCDGCVVCLCESAEIELLDGEVRTGQKTRMYSWVCRLGGCLAGTKAHLDRWADLCVSPPEPPFAVVLSDSWQKQLLYRGVVNFSRDVVVVTLEGEPVQYRPDRLKTVLAAASKVAAAVGKPSLSGPTSAGAAVRIMSRYTDGAAVVDEWESVRGSPLGRLAGALCESGGIGPSAVVHFVDLPRLWPRHLERARRGDGSRVDGDPLIAPFAAAAAEAGGMPSRFDVQAEGAFWLGYHHGRSEFRSARAARPR